MIRLPIRTLALGVACVVSWSTPLSASAAGLCATCGQSHGWSPDAPGARPEKGSSGARSRGAKPGGSTLAARAMAGTQMVFLDFDSATEAGEIVYTDAQRDAVLGNMAADYAGFDYAFTRVRPAAGDFSTITFNEGDPGGLADAIDFRNLSRNDNAIVNVNGLFDQAPTSSQIVTASATIGSHELGHLAGLRHADSFGPIGSGVGSSDSAEGLLPDYPGPTDADETFDNVMASPAAVGSGVVNLTNDTSFGARSAIKLAFNEGGTVTPEQAGLHSTPATAQALTLPTIDLPNTARADGALFGLELEADAEVILGTLAAGDGLDVYAFEAQEGDLFNFEVISQAIDDRNPNPFDTQITITDAAGVALDYYGVVAFNDDELETLDSTIIDLLIPTTGTFFAQVGSFQGDLGDYELLASRFAVVPEPVAGLLLVAGGGFLLGRRRAA